MASVLHYVVRRRRMRPYGDRYHRSVGFDYTGEYAGAGPSALWNRQRKAKKHGERNHVKVTLNRMED